MAIDDGISINVEKLKAKLQERYPNHNFDVPPEPDRKCKQQIGCNRLNNITYTDKEGNTYCGRRYKETEEGNPYKWQYRECHALLQSARQGGEQREIPF